MATPHDHLTSRPLYLFVRLFIKGLVVYTTPSQYNPRSRLRKLKVKIENIITDGRLAVIFSYLHHRNQITIITYNVKKYEFHSQRPCMENRRHSEN